MLQTSRLPARNLQKFYKSIIEAVKTKKNPVILMTNNQPQAAIVSLEDLETIQQAKAKQAGLALLQIATDHKEELKHLPADLRERAEELLYTK